MICLNNTDVIEGGASVNDVVHYQMHGLVGTTFTQLTAGVMSTTLTTALYTANAAISVVSIILVNTHSEEVHITLCLDPVNGGNPRYLIPKTILLGAGYSLHTDGARITVMDASGRIYSRILVGYASHATEHVNGTDDIQSATNAQKGLATAAQITKLEGIEALADVTLTNETSHADVLVDGDIGVTVAAVLGADDNYVTDIEKSNLHAPGSDNQAIASEAETIAGTDATKIVTPDTLAYALQRGTMNYVADAEASDTYVATYVPAVAALITGMVVHFKANTVNTGACTLNVNGLGAIAIKKMHDTDPADGDIEAGQIVTVVYDGTNFQMQSQVATAGAGGGGGGDVTAAANLTANALIVGDDGAKGVKTLALGGALALARVNSAGNAVEFGIAGQIVFPATAVPSADPNTLDDYEEGTWDATLLCGTSGTITLDAAYKTLTYTKIGRKVIIGGTIVVDSVSGPAGALTLHTLPFAVPNNFESQAALTVWPYGLTASATTSIVGIFQRNTTYCQIHKFAAGAIADLAGDIQATTNLGFGGSYPV